MTHAPPPSPPARSPWPSCSPTDLRRQTFVSKVIQHPSKVVEIQMKKPSMSYKPGQYLFLCCPEVSRFQWHPFTISSSPEEEFIGVHIRVVGDWTSTGGPKALAGVCRTISLPRLPCRRSIAFHPDNGLRVLCAGARCRLRCFVWGAVPAAFAKRVGCSFDREPTQPPSTLPRVMIDGPFGSASEDVFNFEVRPRRPDVARQRTTEWIDAARRHKR